MALDNVPPAHIEHHLKRALTARDASPEDVAIWTAKLTKGDAAARADVLGYIEATSPGTLERLDEMWEFFGQRAVHVWRLPYLAEIDVEGALERRSSHRTATGEWTKVIHQPGNDAPRVRKIRVTESEIRFLVWITKQGTSYFEETKQTTKKTEPVNARIAFGAAKIPVVEVYATHQDARSALFALLDWLRAEKTPRSRSVDQQKILDPVTFKESTIVMLAETLNLGDPTEVKGPDATNECGTVVYTGHKAGFATVPLDTQGEKIGPQLSSSNFVRRYNFAYHHDDEFLEKSSVSFHFQGGMSRVTFHTRTSRPAIDWLIVSLRATLGI